MRAAAALAAIVLSSSPALAEVVPMRGLVGMSFDHNGSDVIVVAEKGIIVYSKPKASIAGTVKPGTVLFRGRPWSWDPAVSPVRGTAYVYKAGCAPAPYEVRGKFKSEEFTLGGAAPVRSKTSCAVTGTSTSSGNAKLHFVGTWGDE